MNEQILFIILGMALVTFITRFGSLVLFRQVGIPSFFDKWLRHVPTAILTALIVPSLLLPQGQLDFSFNNHYLLAGIFSALVSYKTRSIIASVGLGMMVMFSLNWLG